MIFHAKREACEKTEEKQLAAAMKNVAITQDVDMAPDEQDVSEESLPERRVHPTLFERRFAPESSTGFTQPRNLGVALHDGIPTDYAQESATPHTIATDTQVDGTCCR